YRFAGSTARRDELDGFAGSMTRLRGAFDALQKMSPVAVPPDSLIDAMQAGNRLGYHPEKAQDEIARFHQVLMNAQQAVDQLQQGLAQRMDDFVRRMSQDALRNVDLDAQKKNRIDAMARAETLVHEAER